MSTFLEDESMKRRLSDVIQLSKKPMKTEREMAMVEIIMLKFKTPEVEVEAAKRIIENTTWPFKLNIYDNRQNTANTAKIWNKLLGDSTCDFVLFIDSDAFVPVGISPCWLTRLMESILAAPVVVPMGDNVGGANKATGAKEYSSAERGWGVWSGYCFLIDRLAILKEYGNNPFNEMFYIYGQDSEFAFRTLKKNDVIFRTDVFVQHKGSYSFKKADEAGEVDREADKILAAHLYKKLTT